MRGSFFRSCTYGGRREIWEGERLNRIIYWSGGGCVVFGGNVKGEVEEGLPVGFDERRESADRTY